MIRMKIRSKMKILESLTSVYTISNYSKLALDIICRVQTSAINLPSNEINYKSKLRCFTFRF